MDGPRLRRARRPVAVLAVLFVLGGCQLLAPLVTPPQVAEDPAGPRRPQLSLVLRNHTPSEARLSYEGKSASSGSGLETLAMPCEVTSAKAELEDEWTVSVNGKVVYDSLHPFPKPRPGQLLLLVIDLRVGKAPNVVAPSLMRADRTGRAQVALDERLRAGVECVR